MKKVFYALLVLMFLSCSNTTDTLIGVWEVDKIGRASCRERV